MRRAMIVALVLTGVLAVGQPGAWARQQTPPVPVSTDSARFLPDVSAFGEGWTELQRTGFQVPGDVFRDASFAVYGGPGGARVIVVAYLSTDARVAVRQAWELGIEAFERYRRTIASEYDRERTERLEGLEPPQGCVEAKRHEGRDREYGFTTGLTMCAVDPDAIITAVASGAVGGQTGFAASDAVMAAALAAAAGGVPATPVTDEEMPTPGPTATEAGGEPAHVAITARELAFEPSELTVPADTPLSVELTNDGGLPHNFTIDELGIDVNIAAGATEQATLTAPAGTYEFYCNIPGHREGGMVGTLTAE